MRTAIPAQSRIAHNQSPAASFPCLAQILAASVFIVVLQFSITSRLSAQATVTPVPAHKPLHPRSHPAKATSPTPATQSAPEPPPTPKPPDWPANDHPSEATVVWNSQGLRIDASNSSLSQILKDVSTATGLKVDGLGADERIFGTYGPAPARDVLANLLDGSGYNVLIIGDQGQGTPRQIVLTLRLKGDAPQAANTPASSNDENADADEQQEQPQPQGPPALRNGFAPGAPPRTPQQIMQEMQQRQRQQQIEQNNPQ